MSEYNTQVKVRAAFYQCQNATRKTIQHSFMFNALNVFKAEKLKPKSADIKILALSLSPRIIKHGQISSSL